MRSQRIDPGRRSRPQRSLPNGGIRTRQLGFTLLEIMVVVALIVLTVSLIGVNLGRDLDQLAELEARRFARLVEHVRDESILSGKTYAIKIDEAGRSYQFLEAEDGWKSVVRDDVLRQRHIPEPLSIRFEVPQQTVASQALVVIQGLGQITPFRLFVAGEKFWHVVSLDDSTNIRINRSPKDAI